jgi:hypothetical protein
VSWGLRGELVLSCGNWNFAGRSAEIDRLDGGG